VVAYTGLSRGRPNQISFKYRLTDLDASWTDHDGADLREAAADAGAAGYVVKDNLLELRRLLDTGLGHPTRRTRN